jgi:hypothetical protein
VDACPFFLGFFLHDIFFFVRVVTDELSLGDGTRTFMRTWLVLAVCCSSKIARIVRLGGTQVDRRVVGVGDGGRSMIVIVARVGICRIRVLCSEVRVSIASNTTHRVADVALSIVFKGRRRGPVWRRHGWIAGTLLIAAVVTVVVGHGGGKMRSLDEMEIYCWLEIKGAASLA